MIEATDLQYGSVSIGEEMHFSGGIRGYRAGHGWSIGPVLHEGEYKNFGPVPNGKIRQVASELGVTMLGINKFVFDGPNLPAQIWSSMLSKLPDGFSAADIWGAISNHARKAEDHDYADLARNVSVSLRAADIRLRDASNEYRGQLLAGLARGVVVRQRFTNIPLSDLYLAFHSLTAEMGAARDYLSTIVALHLNAPRNIDSLARLMNWAKKEANSGLSNHCLLSPLVAGWCECEPDRWLFDLGEYRNAFLHREPFGVNGIEAGVAIHVAETPYGPVYTLKLEMPDRRAAGDTVEALDRFVQLYSQLVTLATQIGGNARYPSTLPTFVAR